VSAAFAMVAVVVLVLALAAGAQAGSTALGSSRAARARARSVASLRSTPDLASWVAALHRRGCTFVPPRWLRSRSAREVERALPDALEDLASAVRAGASLPSAIGAAAVGAPPVLRGDLDVVAGAIARGAPIAEALGAWAQRRPLPAVAVAVAGVQLASDVGGAEADSFVRIAATVRERVAVVDDLRAASVQARASGLVLAVAPVGFAGFSGVVDGAMFRAALTSPMGASCLVAGVALDVLGGWWMLRLSGSRP
jgi:tight adherence protein B